MCIRYELFIRTASFTNYDCLISIKSNIYSVGHQCNILLEILSDMIHFLCTRLKNTDRTINFTKSWIFLIIKITFSNSHFIREIVTEHLNSMYWLRYFNMQCTLNKIFQARLPPNVCGHTTVNNNRSKKLLNYSLSLIDLSVA